MIDTDTAFNLLAPICTRCITFTRLITTEAEDGRLYATIETELTSFDGLGARFQKTGWNVIQIDNLGGYMYLFTLTAVKS
jgi:hypothetical protein